MSAAPSASISPGSLTGEWRGEGGQGNAGNNPDVVVSDGGDDGSSGGNNNNNNNNNGPLGPDDTGNEDEDGGEAFIIPFIAIAVLAVGGIAFFVWRKKKARKTGVTSLKKPDAGEQTSPLKTSKLFKHTSKSSSFDSVYGSKTTDNPLAHGPATSPASPDIVVQDVHTARSSVVLGAAPYAIGYAPSSIGSAPRKPTKARVKSADPAARMRRIQDQLRKNNPGSSLVVS